MNAASTGSVRDSATPAIRAETVAWEPLLRLKSHVACREQALLRLEGKQYIVQDGDIVHIRHNM